jgi:dimethylhistidine N-methyltransferase
MNRSTNAADVSNTFWNEVCHGLSQEQKALPCKYLYDERGSDLFDQICETEEYYPTRTELEIMRDNADSIAYQIGKRVMLVEYGSGSSVKTRILLDALDEPASYVPVDISEDHLLRTAEGLQLAYPHIEVLPVVADFTKPFDLPTSSCDHSHVALYFPGSTIGNFTPAEAGELLRFMASMLGPQGGLLIGIDLQKDVSVIEAAYNDADGVTADFSLNLLERINSELDGQFDLGNFEHKAVYNDVAHRMEMSIVSTVDQSVNVGDRVFHFEAGEEILTEYSHKYTVEGFADFAARFGFSLHKQWTDDREYFGVLHLVLD